ncbi:mitotic regulator LTE1 SCDLUD_000476 [Saccharomycodes ludwigii]|uniref:mitotic regulator LTE1 n=1 Tax=Saccharomycodes ludwigii TaxID=36035 RepID=UPI001E8789A9|nr:hypothetical protein SCDLUD_000476 [Saccharomycodes ludwigii]KAH3902881.1 hypothetical protein SCDLUD_000476 [Saccharomycodes ludwigii]
MFKDQHEKASNTEECTSVGSVYHVSPSSIFNDPDYYPTPSSNVINITYKQTAASNATNNNKTLPTKIQKKIISSTIEALIVTLSSPIDVVDYNLFSDFFIIYRRFLSCTDLLSLLINRFNWCIGEVLNTTPSTKKNGVNEKRHKLGEIALVRTFVLLRHWVLNYFIEDFATSHTLTEQFLNFLNSSHNILINSGHDNKSSNNSKKVISNVIVNLKKCWISRLSITIDGFQLPNLPTVSNGNISQYVTDWLLYKIKDPFSKTKSSKGENDDSSGDNWIRNKSKNSLSFYAIESSSNPGFRNQSFLSIYNGNNINNLNFKLPTFDELKDNNDNINKTHNIATGMLRSKTPILANSKSRNSFLYPRNFTTPIVDNKGIKDNANVGENKTTASNLSSSSLGKKTQLPLQNKVEKTNKVSEAPENINNSNNIKIFLNSLEYPSSSKIDKIIPPTPAKKIEFVISTNEPLLRPPPTSEKKVKDPGNTLTLTTSNKVENTCFTRDSSYSSITSLKKKITRGSVNELLSRWSINHKTHNNNQLLKRSSISGPATENNTLDKMKAKNAVTTHTDSEDNQKNMNNLVKYVFSITSLDSKPNNATDIFMETPKFDILSARSIDQVEYLIEMENKLLKELSAQRQQKEKQQKLVDSSEKDKYFTTPENHKILDFPDANEDTDNINIDNDNVQTEQQNGAEDVKTPAPINGMDNLNLYYTVNSIANSVLSISNQLNRQKSQSTSNNFVNLQNSDLSSSSVVGNTLAQKPEYVLKSPFFQDRKSTKNNSGLPTKTNHSIGLNKNNSMVLRRKHKKNESNPSIFLASKNKSFLYSLEKVGYSSADCELLSQHALNNTPTKAINYDYKLQRLSNFSASRYSQGSTLSYITYDSNLSISMDQITKGSLIQINDQRGEINTNTISPSNNTNDKCTVLRRKSGINNLRDVTKDKGQQADNNGDDTNNSIHTGRNIALPLEVPRRSSKRYFRNNNIANIQKIKNLNEIGEGKGGNNTAILSQKDASPVGKVTYITDNGGNLSSNVELSSSTALPSNNTNIENSLALNSINDDAANLSERQPSIKNSGRIYINQRSLVRKNSVTPLKNLNKKSSHPRHQSVPVVIRSPLENRSFIKKDSILVEQELRLMEKDNTNHEGLRNTIQIIDHENNGTSIYTEDEDENSDFPSIMKLSPVSPTSIKRDKLIVKNEYQLERLEKAISCLLVSDTVLNRKSYRSSTSSISSVSTDVILVSPKKNNFDIINGKNDERVSLNMPSIEQGVLKESTSNKTLKASEYSFLKESNSNRTLKGPGSGFIKESNSNKTITSHPLLPDASKDDERVADSLKQNVATSTSRDRKVESTSIESLVKYIKESSNDCIDKIISDTGTLEIDTEKKIVLEQAETSDKMDLRKAFKAKHGGSLYLEESKSDLSFLDFSIDSLSHHGSLKYPRNNGKNYIFSADEDEHGEKEKIATGVATDEYVDRLKPTSILEGDNSHISDNGDDISSAAADDNINANYTFEKIVEDDALSADNGAITAKNNHHNNFFVADSTNDNQNTSALDVGSIATSANIDAEEDSTTEVRNSFVNGLKKKFLPSSVKTSSLLEVNSADSTEPLHFSSSTMNVTKKGNTPNIVTFAQMPDESFQNNNPVDVALMKLEGTYSKEDGKSEKRKISSDNDDTEDHDRLNSKEDMLNSLKSTPPSSSNDSSKFVDQKDPFTKPSNSADDGTAPFLRTLNRLSPERNPLFKNTSTTNLSNRQSLLIEKRRNNRRFTMYEYFPDNKDQHNDDDDDVKENETNNSNNTNENPRYNFVLENSADEQVRNLLNGYQMDDFKLGLQNANEHIPFILMYDSLSIAIQMTLIERDVLNEIDWKDLLTLNMQHSLPTFTTWLQVLFYNEHLTGIDLAVSRFNLCVDWIISEIVLTTNTKLRRNTIQRFIHIAEHCVKMQNFNTVLQIVLALNSIIVQTYNESWRLVEPGDLLTWEELKKIPSLDRNFSTIRKFMNEMDPIKGCVPFIVLYLSDLSLNEQKKDWLSENMVNYGKFETSVDIVKNFIQRVQWGVQFYDITPDSELLSKCVYISCLTPEELEIATKV